MERTLNLSKVDGVFLEKVMSSHTGRTVSYCYQCGTCSSSCPVVEEMDIKPHEMVEMIKLGLTEALSQCKAIWQCTTCYMCTERCPQEVQLTTIVLGLRDMAMRERAVIPEAVKESCKNLYDTGRLVTLSQFQRQQREKLKLPNVPQIDTEPTKGMIKNTRVANILEVK